MARTQRERKTIITDEPSLCPEMEDVQNIGDSIPSRISEQSKNSGMEKTDEETSQNDDCLENLERKQSSSVSSKTPVAEVTDVREVKLFTEVTETTDKEASDKGLEYFERKQSSSETSIMEVPDVAVFTEVATSQEIQKSSSDSHLTTTEDEMERSYELWKKKRRKKVYTEGKFWVTKDAERERCGSNSSSDVKGDILEKLRVFKMRSLNERRLNILEKYYITTRKHCKDVNFYDRLNRESDKSPERVQDMPCQCHLEEKIGNTDEGCEEKEEPKQGSCEEKEEPKQGSCEEKEEAKQGSCEEKDEPNRGGCEEKEVLNQGGYEGKEVLHQKGTEEKEEPNRGRTCEQSMIPTTSQIPVEHNNTCYIRRLARYFRLIAEYFTDEEVDPDLFVLCSPEKEKYRDSSVVDYRKKIKNKARQIMLLKLRLGLKGKLEYNEFDEVEKIRDVKRWCIYRAARDLLKELTKASGGEESSVEESGSEESIEKETSRKESSEKESSRKESSEKESSRKESSETENSETESSRKESIGESDCDQKSSIRKVAIDPEQLKQYEMLKVQYSQLKKKLKEKLGERKIGSIRGDPREGYLRETLEHLDKLVNHDRSMMSAWVAAAVRQELGDERENKELESEKDVEMENEPRGATNGEQEKELKSNEDKDKIRESVVEGNSKDISEKLKRKNVSDKEQVSKRLKMEEQTYENQEERKKSETESTKRDENEEGMTREVENERKERKRRGAEKLCVEPESKRKREEKQEKESHK